jgi:hypothetical protein
MTGFAPAGAPARAGAWPSGALALLGRETDSPQGSLKTGDAAAPRP